MLLLVNVDLKASFFLRTWCAFIQRQGKKIKLILYIWSMVQFLLSFGSLSDCNIVINQTPLQILQCYFHYRLFSKITILFMTWNFRTFLLKFIWGIQCYHLKKYVYVSQLEILTFNCEVHYLFPQVSAISSWEIPNKSHLSLQDLTCSFIFLNRIFKNIY